MLMIGSTNLMKVQAGAQLCQACLLRQFKQLISGFQEETNNCYKLYFVYFKLFRLFRSSSTFILSSTRVYPTKVSKQLLIISNYFNLFRSSSIESIILY